jgi:hypothetical protein
MAFGDTGILDDFNRSDGSPGANWSAMWGDPQFTISSNQAYAAAAWRSGYWNVEEFGPDCEAYITNVTPSTNYFFIRLAATASPSGYYFRIMMDTGRIYRIDSGASTQLGAEFSMAYDAGDGIGIECVDDDIQVYENTGSGWSQLATRNDETYPDAGYLGFDCAAAGYWDDFGGGTLGGAGGADFWLW